MENRAKLLAMIQGGKQADKIATKEQAQIVDNLGVDLENAKAEITKI